MQRVIVSVKRKDDFQSHDLEVTATIDIATLVDMIATALRWDMDHSGQSIRYQIEAKPPGRMLQPGESLASVEAWDGSWLILHPVGSRTLGASRDKLPNNQVGATDASSGPVTGWRSLGIALPSDIEASDEQARDDASKSSGFVWKKLDD